MPREIEARERRIPRLGGVARVAVDATAFLSVAAGSVAAVPNVSIAEPHHPSAPIVAHIPDKPPSLAQPDTSKTTVIRVPSGGSFSSIATQMLKEAHADPTVPLVNALASADAGLNPAISNPNILQPGERVIVFSVRTAAEIAGVEKDPQTDKVFYIKDDINKVNNEPTDSSMKDPKVRKDDEQLGVDIENTNSKILEYFLPASQEGINIYATGLIIDTLNTFANVPENGLNKFDEPILSANSDGSTDYELTKQQLGFGVSINIAANGQSQLENAWNTVDPKQRFVELEALLPHVNFVEFVPDASVPVIYRLIPDNANGWKFEERQTRHTTGITEIGDPLVGNFLPTVLDNQTLELIQGRTDEFFNRIPAPTS